MQVHIAAHCVVDSEQPRGAILLASTAGQQGPGLLTANAIADQWGSKDAQQAAVGPPDGVERLQLGCDTAAGICHERFMKRAAAVHLAGAVAKQVRGGG